MKLIVLKLPSSISIKFTECQMKKRLMFMATIPGMKLSSLRKKSVSSLSEFIFLMCTLGNPFA